MSTFGLLLFMGQAKTRTGREARQQPSLCTSLDFLESRNDDADPTMASGERRLRRSKAVVYFLVALLTFSIFRLTRSLPLALPHTTRQVDELVQRNHALEALNRELKQQLKLVNQSKLLHDASSHARTIDPQERDGKLTPITWLRFVIVTVGRTPETDYLLRTLETLFSVAPVSPNHPLRQSSEIVVVNNHNPPEEHSVFLRAQKYYGRRVTFLNKADTTGNCVPGSIKGKAGLKIQRQNCGLVGAMEAVLKLPPSEYVLMMEDDWLFCPNGLFALSYFMDKASSYDPNWIALRVSYGFNGIVLRTSDLISLQTHLAQSYTRRPPDHLVFEWFAGELKETRDYASGRSYRIFRHNLFYHIGSVSTLQTPNKAKKRFNPECFSLMYDWLLPAEVFNTTLCPQDDVYPCTESRAVRRNYPFSQPILHWSTMNWTAFTLKPIDVLR